MLYSAVLYSATFLRTLGLECGSVEFASCGLLAHLLATVQYCRLSVQIHVYLFDLGFYCPSQHSPLTTSLDVCLCLWLCLLACPHTLFRVDKPPRASLTQFPQHIYSKISNCSTVLYTSGTALAPHTVSPRAFGVSIPPFVPLVLCFSAITDTGICTTALCSK